MIYRLALTGTEWARIFRFRLSSWLRLSASAGAVAISDVRDSVVLAFLTTSVVALIDAYGLTRLDSLRDLNWYDRVDFIESFPRSSASGDLLAVIFAAMAIIVALLFSISLVAHQVATERFGETVAPLLFREPLTAFIRSFLVIGSIFVLTNLFVQRADVYVPFLGTYLSFGAVILSIALLPVYVSQSLSSAKVGGAAHHLSRDALAAIRAVSVGRRQGPSVETHLRARTTRSLSDAQLLIDQLEQKLADERGAATVVVALPSVIRYYLARKRLIDVDSEWYPIHEVVERTPYGHSILREIYGRLASGPPRQRERNHEWLELMVIAMLQDVEERAYDHKQFTLFDASITALSGIFDAAVVELRFDLMERILGKWSELCGRLIDDDGLADSLPRGIATAAELLTRMDDPKEALQGIASHLADGEFDVDAKPDSLAAIVDEYCRGLRTEIAHEGRVVTSKEFIERDLANAWGQKLGNEPGRLLGLSFDALAKLAGKLLALKAAKRAQETALASLVIQRRVVVIGGAEPSRERVTEGASLALAAYLLDGDDPLQARELLGELVQWVALAIHTERHSLAEVIVEPTVALVAKEVEQGNARRINATRTLLAVGGLLKLDAEVRQDNTLLASYIDKSIRAGFRREPMEALRDPHLRMFTRAIGGDLIMEFQWLANAFHAKIDALVQPGTSAFSLNPRIDHPSSLIQAWAPRLGIEDLVDAFLDDLVSSYPTSSEAEGQEPGSEDG